MAQLANPNPELHGQGGLIAKPQWDATHSDKPIDGPPEGSRQKLAISGTLRHVEFTLETHRI
jgi:hypothetical protein